MKRKGQRVIVIVALIALSAVLAVITVTHPSFAAENAFLKEFVSHELLAFLIIPLTITFASVANIHLQVSNMVRSLRDPAAQRRLEESFAKPLRREINSSAWLLFWTFVVSAVALVIKGAWSTNVYLTSAVADLAIIAVAINAVVLFDIHKTIFELAPVVRGDGASPGAQDDSSTKPD